jgi:hypothetical protein
MPDAVAPGTRALCFVDMPFGKKADLASGTEIDFDQIYQAGIKPAIADAGLEALRGDEERTGGIIHSAMFARLLLAEFVVADLTLANPNVFYELGIRHAAKPFTTVPIFANVRALPFDVGLVRAIPYEVEKGKLTEESAKRLRDELTRRLQEAARAATTDSPLFQLLPKFPGIDLPHDVTDAFQERVQHEEQFRELLDRARNQPTNDERRTALLRIQTELEDLAAVQRSILVDLLLSYRAVEAWPEMVALCEAMPQHLKDVIVVRQQWAFALNRRTQPGDRDKAVRLLEELVKQRGPDPETLGILGRVHKDRYKEAKKAKSIMAAAALDDAIGAYTRGFEADPRDYYPGVNAITLLIEKGTPEAMKEADHLVPLVAFAVARRGGATSNDYWDLATTLELACIGGDWATAGRVLPRVIATARESFMPRTTADNLDLLKQARQRQGQELPQVDEIIVTLRQRGTELSGGK